MPHKPLSDLPDPLFLVISQTDLLAHNAPANSSWHTFLENRLNQPWVGALTEAYEHQDGISQIAASIRDNPIRGSIQISLTPSGDWVNIEAHWFGDEQTHKTYLSLSQKLTPLGSPRAQDHELETVSNRPLILRLKQAESRLETYLHHFPGVLFSQRPDGSFAFVSPKMEEWIGDASKRLNRSTSGLRELIAPEDREKALSTISENSPLGKPYSLQYRILNPESRALIYVYDIRLPIVLSNGTHLQDEGIWIDVTRQAVAENRISHSLWKENLASITSGLVHDFSNSMAGIFSLSELYHAEMEPDHPRQEGMGQIKSHAMRAQKLVRRIVDMNRDIAADASYHNLETLIRDYEDIISIILPKSTQLDFQFPDEELLVYLDEVAFRQALTHFVTNTRDALPSGGTFGIHVDSIPGGFEIHIWDDGAGIPDSEKTRIFEPFYSTKDPDTAAGFGLYAAKAFVELAGGSIRLGAGRFPGAHFIVYLPDADSVRSDINRESSYLANIDSESESVVSEAPQAPYKSSAYLIIINPEDEAGPFLNDGLSSKNWTIITAASSTEAAKLIDAKDEGPSVIIFALGKTASLKIEDLEPLNQWTEEAMITLFTMPECTRPSPDIIESFDMLLDTSIGIQGISSRLEPWMA